jgi:hypothetical protein
MLREKEQSNEKRIRFDLARTNTKPTTQEWTRKPLFLVHHLQSYLSERKNNMHLNECQTFGMYNDAILPFFTYLGILPHFPDSMPHQPQQ